MLVALDLNLGHVFLSLSKYKMAVVFLRFINLENWFIELVIWTLEMVFLLTSSPKTLKKFSRWILVGLEGKFVKVVDHYYLRGPFNNFSLLECLILLTKIIFHLVLPN